MAFLTAHALLRFTTAAPQGQSADVPDLPSTVLEHLQVKGPAKAHQIATDLDVDRNLVNQALYGALKGRVSQDKDFAWSLAGKPRSHTTPPASAAPSGAYRGLFSYYLDCLAQDDDDGVSVFADSRYDLDYVELTSWPLEASDAAIDGEHFTVGRRTGRVARQPPIAGLQKLLRPAIVEPGYAPNLTTLLFGSVVVA